MLKERKKTSLPLHRINKMGDLYEHSMAAIKPVVLKKDANGKLELQITSQDISGESWKKKSQHFRRFSVLQTFACTLPGCNPTGTFREKNYFKTDVRIFELQTGQDIPRKQVWNRTTLTLGILRILRAFEWAQEGGNPTFSLPEKLEKNSEFATTQELFHKKWNGNRLSQIFSTFSHLNAKKH